MLAKLAKLLLAHLNHSGNLDDIENQALLVSCDYVLAKIGKFIIRVLKILE